MATDSISTTELSTKTNQGELPGIGMVAVGALAFSSLALFTRPIQGMEAQAIAFFRILFGFGFLSILLVRDRTPLRINNFRKEIPKILLVGVLISGTASLYIYSLQYTSVANAALLVNTSPIYVAMLGPWLLKEAPPKFILPSLALVIGGTALISGVGRETMNDGSMWGIAAGALAGFIYSFVIMLSRSLGRTVGGYTQGLWGAGVGSLVLLPLAINTPWQVVQVNLVYLIPAGMITLGFSTLMYYKALQRVRAQVVSVVAILEPVFGILLGWLVFAERLDAFEILGCVLVLGGILLISRY